jgi:hypothetical protein
MQNRTWNKLLEFESRDLIKRFIKNKFDRDSSERQILEISSNFIQGREYFKNAQQSAITVKPLLLYYGVTALTRGLILAMSPYLSESSLKPSHGLDTLDWQKHLAKKDFGNLTSTIRQGTFYDLLTSTSNKSYFKHNSSGVSWHLQFPIPELQASIKLMDLIQTMPDFSEEFESWAETKLSYLTVSGFNKLDSGEREFVVEKPKKNENAIKEIFPNEIFGNYQTSESPRGISLITKSGSIPHFSQKFHDPFNAGIGQIAVTKPINQDIYLSSLAQFYALSFFLGMLSRYFPSIWISLGRTAKGDAIYPLFIKIIDIINHQFPTLVMDYLTGPYEFEKETID